MTDRFDPSNESSSRNDVRPCGTPAPSAPRGLKQAAQGDPQSAHHRVVIIGGGVHAVVVTDCVQQAGGATVVGYTDYSSHDRSWMRACGVDYLGPDGDLLALVGQGRVHAAVIGLGGVEHTAARRRVAKEVESAVPRWWTAIHPAATIADSASVGDGTVVLAGAVLNPFAQIGCHGVVNTSAVLDHHCEVGDFVSIAPHATLCGCVRVGEGAFVGAGATVITGIRIGAGSIVGAGAVVIRDVPDGVVVAGNPARVIRGVERAGQRDAAAFANAPTAE